MTSPAWGFAMRGEDTDTLEIDIYDDVGRYAEYYGGASAKGMRDKLKAATKAKTITLRVNSAGGDVSEGFSIYNQLNEHPARVIAHVDALAASIASVIIMAADEIHVAQNAFVMIHNPWVWGARGESKDLRSLADRLDKIRDEAITAYAARTGQDRETLRRMMADTTWMTATEAKSLGFADFVKPVKKKAERANARASANAFAVLNLASLDHVPDELRERVESARQSFEGVQTPVQTPIAQTASNDEYQETDAMADDLKTVLAALGVSTVADAVARSSQLLKLESATGKTGDEAHGVLQAFKASHSEIATVRSELETVKTENAKLKGEGELAQLDAAIAKAKTENRLTAATEKEVREQFAAKEISLKGALAWLGAMSAIPALANSGKQPAAANGAAGAQNGAAPLTHNGKTWDELKPAQRAALKQEDPAKYDAMRTAAGLV